MGEARRRGTFEERKEQAIQSGRKRNKSRKIPPVSNSYLEPRVEFHDEKGGTVLLPLYEFMKMHTYFWKFAFRHMWE